MPLKTELQVRGFVLNPLEERRIERNLNRLERRLKDDNDAVVQIVLDWHDDQRRVHASLRLSRTNLGGIFVSHVSAETADQAVREATDEIERQIEKRMATLRGEETYGVPSRRRMRDALHGPPLGVDATDEDEIDDIDAVFDAEVDEEEDEER